MVSQFEVYDGFSPKPRADEQKKASGLTIWGLKRASLPLIPH